MKMYIISDNIDTLTGMKLGGIDGIVAHTKEEMETALGSAINNPDIGILLVSEKINEQFRALLDEVKISRSLPLVVSVPDRHGSTKDDDYITSFVAQSIGLKL